MGVKYNPFAGNLDIVDSPSGDFSDIDISGDLSLGTGTPTTTLQAVTPTANRTISFPDATGTVALVSGADGTVQYNEAGVLKGNSDFTVDPDWNNASTVFTGLKLNVTDTASAAGSNLLDLQSGGTSKFVVSAAGVAEVTGTTGKIGHNTSSSGGSAIINGGISVGAAAKLLFAASAPTGGDLALARDSAGVVKITDGSTGTGYIKQTPVAVSALPAAATVGAGTRGFVNDANATTFASVVASGGSNVVPVYSDGTNWLIG